VAGLLLRSIGAVNDDTANSIRRRRLDRAISRVGPKDQRALADALEALA
jgi:hypothetical protein